MGRVGLYPRSATGIPPICAVILSKTVRLVVYYPAIYVVLLRCRTTADGTPTPTSTNLSGVAGMRYPLTRINKPLLSD